MVLTPQHLIWLKTDQQTFKLKIGDGSKLTFAKFFFPHCKVYCTVYIYFNNKYMNFYVYYTAFMNRLFKCSNTSENLI